MNLEPRGGPDLWSVPASPRPPRRVAWSFPDTAKEKPQQGEVLAVGPGKRSEQTGDLIPVDVAVGDTVIYAKYGGTEISSGGEDLLILSTLATCWRSSSSPARRSDITWQRC